MCFDDAKFSGGMVRFENAIFSSRILRFPDADFSGGAVDFSHAQFATGERALRRVTADWLVSSAGLPRRLQASPCPEA